MIVSKAAAAAAAFMAFLASPAAAQQPPDPAATTPPPAATATQEHDDAVLNPAQPDFTLVALPTGLRLPKGKFVFRVTHRFLRPLGQGDFGDLVGDAFGLDNGAITALELRYGLLPGTQVGIHRSSLGKTVSFFAEHDLLTAMQDKLDVAIWGAIDGTQNFKDAYRPSVGAVLTHLVGNVGAVYVEPMFVGNTDPAPGDVTDSNNSVFIGLGTRLQVRKATYVVFEWSPRVAGYDPTPRVDAIAFGLEKRVGGHMFQLNFSNSFATTMSQVARGGSNNDDWFFGFNLVRKFY